MGADMPAFPPLPSAFVDTLEQQFGSRFSVAQAVRDQYGRDESPFPPMPPQAVVRAHSNEEVRQVVRACAEHRVPLIPYGAGSSLEGHILAVQGGLTLDLSEMNQILAVQPEDLTVTVQAGVTRRQLNDYLRDTGLFFPIDPGADATLGGMCATRASGTNAVRYGTMRENVLSLRAVMPDGELIKTASRAKKSSTGYDLTRLLIGSEGTLGVITEVTVKLYPQPEAVSAAICGFPSVDQAVAAVIQTIQLGIPVARVELLDTHTVRAVNLYSKLALHEGPMLLFEFHGSPAGVTEQAQTVQDICHEFDGQDFEWATHQEDRNRLWTARHNAYFATLQLRPGATAISTDCCVPISRLAECIAQTNADLAQASFPSCVVGHVGDGNFHVQMLIDPANPTEWEEAEAVNQRLVRRAIQMDGTCTGEHGVGLHKMDFIIEEHGAETIAWMRRIKQAFDPFNIMNPGKLLKPQS